MGGIPHTSLCFYENCMEFEKEERVCVITVGRPSFRNATRLCARVIVLNNCFACVLCCHGNPLHLKTTKLQAIFG